MREFGDWVMQVPKKTSTKTELNSRREMLTEMMDDMNRMLSDFDGQHPQDPPSKKDSYYMAYSNIPQHIHNICESEYEMYKGVTPYEV